MDRDRINAATYCLELAKFSRVYFAVLAFAGSVCAVVSLLIRLQNRGGTCPLPAADRGIKSDSALHPSKDLVKGKNQLFFFTSLYMLVMVIYCQIHQQSCESAEQVRTNVNNKTFEV